MFKGIQHFWVTDHGRTAYSVYPDSGNDRFYDDNVWIGLDMAKWYAISKDVRYLNQAKEVSCVNFTISGTILAVAEFIGKS